MIPRAIRKILLPSCMVATVAFCVFASRAPSRSANASPPHTDEAVALPERPAAVVPSAGAARRAKNAVAAPEHLASQASAEASGPGVTGMVVARDPETGQLGMPSPEQMRAINERRAEILRITPEGFTEIRRPDGAVGLELNGRLQSYSVVRVGADGRARFECVSARSDTAAVSAAPAAALEER